MLRVVVLQTGGGWGGEAAVGSGWGGDAASGASRYEGSQGSSGSRRGRQVSNREPAGSDYMQSLVPPATSSIKVCYHASP